MAADVDTVNSVAVASFAYVNDVPLQHLLQYLEHRPQEVAPSSVERMNTLYMWNNPNRGRQYRAQRFVYCVALQWYVDLNLGESRGSTANSSRVAASNVSRATTINICTPRSSVPATLIH